MTHNLVMKISLGNLISILNNLWEVAGMKVMLRDSAVFVLITCNLICLEGLLTLGEDHSLYIVHQLRNGIFFFFMFPNKQGLNSVTQSADLGSLTFTVGGVYPCIGSVDILR